MDIKIKVKVTPNAKQNCITNTEWEDDVLLLTAKVTAIAQDGKANKALLELLAEYLSTSKSHLEIIKGHTIRNKTIMAYNINEQTLLIPKQLRLHK